MRAGATLGFEDALGLTRSLSLLGGDYLPVARQLLKVGTAPLGWDMPASCCGRVCKLHQASQGRAFAHFRCCSAVVCLTISSSHHRTTRLQDLTVTVSHPHYCAAVLSPASQPAFVRRLVALWTQLTTAEERWVPARPAAFAGGSRGSP